VPILHEAKILEIDPDAMERLILDKGCQKLGEWFMRRYVYDITPPDDLTTWIRLRDTDDETTLTVKQITSDAIDSTHASTAVAMEEYVSANAPLSSLVDPLSADTPSTPGTELTAII
jgi:adenylate cyclase class 2